MLIQPSTRLWSRVYDKYYPGGTPIFTDMFDMDLLNREFKVEGEVGGEPRPLPLIPCVSKMPMQPCVTPVQSHARRMTSCSCPAAGSCCRTTS